MSTPSLSLSLFNLSPKCENMEIEPSRAHFKSPLCRGGGMQLNTPQQQQRQPNTTTRTSRWTKSSNNRSFDVTIMQTVKQIMDPYYMDYKSWLLYSLISVHCVRASKAVLSVLVPIWVCRCKIRILLNAFKIAQFLTFTSNIKERTA